MNISYPRAADEGQEPEAALSRSAVRLTGVPCTVSDGEQIQPPTQQEEVVMTSRPVGQEGHCFFSYLHFCII